MAVMFGSQRRQLVSCSVPIQLYEAFLLMLKYKTTESVTHTHTHTLPIPPFLCVLPLVCVLSTVHSSVLMVRPSVCLSVHSLA